MSFVVIPKPQRSPLPYQIIAVLTGSLLVFFLATGFAAGGYQLIYSDRILPGVSVAGVDLSNMSQDQASTALGQKLVFPYQGKILFADGDHVWVATPAELGMVFDIGASVHRAYAVGRGGGLFGNLDGQVISRLGGVAIPPVIVLDKSVAYAYLQKLASQIDQPPVEADLHLDGIRVAYTPGRTGQLLNVDATMGTLAAQLLSLKDGEVPLVVENHPPLILDGSAAAASLRQLVSAPLSLSIPNPQTGDPAPWQTDVPQLADMVVIQQVETGSAWQYQLDVDPTSLQPLLDQIATQINRTPENARFTFNDTTRQLDLIQPSVSGRILDEQASLQAVRDGLLRGEHAVDLVIAQAPPRVGDDATAALLGITGLVSERSLYFRGSTSDRIQNIVTASARFHGLLVPPNSVFSMSGALGDVSLDNGYAEAPIIYNGQSILGVGGGLCQVSTTLFQTAFYGGYPIVERTQHAYRVRYYEEDATGYDPNLVGLDATVFVPLVDLKFKNDRSSWLLMEVYVNTMIDRITWKFYSADARKVDVAPPIISDVVPPPTEWQFLENPSMAPGEIAVDQTAADGEKVVVNRTVYQSDGTMLFAGATQTTYAPRQAICWYGSGTQNPQALAQEAGLCQP
jgi:vancomycin resistance protein YoaR